jgi:hypothetical protein
MKILGNIGGRVKSFIETFILIPYIFWILGDQSPEFQDNIFGYLTSFFSFFSHLLLGEERESCWIPTQREKVVARERFRPQKLFIFVSKYSI